MAIEKTPLHEALRRADIPEFENNTHIVTPSTSHPNMWVWTSKQNPISTFCINCTINWLIDNYRFRDTDVPVWEVLKNIKNGLKRKKKQLVRRN